MTKEKPHDVKPSHIARSAIVYVRQSSEEQVEQNQGSTEYQRSQAEIALAWGWPRDRIELIETDLGLSGSAAEHRKGYTRLVEEVRAGRVGAVFVSDFSRLGRNAIDWLMLLRDLGHHDVLVVVDGRVYDPNDQRGLFATKILALTGEYDNHSRREAMEQGRIAKIRAGKAISQPPTGYLRGPDGSWIKDLDAAVRHGISTVFRTFLTERSLRRTVDSLNARGLSVPRRRCDQQVHWAAPTVNNVQTILNNERYTGAYIYRHRTSDPRLGRDARGRLRLRKATDAERMVVPDHHDAYVSRNDWEAIRSILKDNRWGGEHGCGPRNGNALLAGLIRCSLHREWSMMPHYKVKRRDGRRSHGYHCAGDYATGGPKCGTRPGNSIDREVVREVMKRLAPPTIEVMREEWRRAMNDQLSEGRQLRSELRRVEQEIEELRSELRIVRHQSPRVRNRVEGELENALRRAESLGADTKEPSAAESLFDEGSFHELVSLSRDIEALWNAPTTTLRDQKEILRAAIERVFLERFDRDSIELKIRWRDDRTETPVRVGLPAFTHRLMAEWNAEGVSAEEIVKRFEACGLLTKWGTCWNARAVERALHRLARKNS